MPAADAGRDAQQTAQGTAPAGAADTPEADSIVTPQPAPTELAKYDTMVGISRIVVGPRFRKELGDVSGLANSIAAIGMLHPIVLTEHGVLIAGRRGLAACKKLGWKRVPVTIVPLDDLVRGEFEENAQRKDFLPSEIEAIRCAMEPAEKAAAKEREREGGRAKGSGNFPDPGQTRDKIGAFASASGRSVEKIAVVAAAAT